MRQDAVTPTAVPGDEGKERLCLRRPLTLTRGEQRISGFLEPCLAAVVTHQVQGMRTPEEKLCPFGVIDWPELECLAVVPLGRKKGVERERTVAGFAQRNARMLHELGPSVGSCRSRELERGRPVMGEHLGMVVRSAEALDPLGDAPVLLRAVGPRDLPVGDVPHERVRERELALAVDR